MSAASVVWPVFLYLHDTVADIWKRDGESENTRMGYIWNTYYSYFLWDFPEHISISILSACTSESKVRGGRKR